MPISIHVLTVVHPHNEVPIVYRCIYENNKKSLADTVKSACVALAIDMSDKDKFSNIVHSLMTNGVCWVESNYNTDYCFQVFTMCTF